MKNQSIQGVDIQLNKVGGHPYTFLGLQAWLEWAYEYTQVGILRWLRLQRLSHWLLFD